MYREDYSVSKISRELLLNRRTVRSYLSMSESQYELFLINQCERKKELQPFEDFVKTRLEKYQDTSAAQMHDWLKEKHSDFPYTSPKTVYNFVMWVRQKYNLPKISPGREYMIVEELPYGQQAQVDFGEYNLRDVNGKRVKVWFFVMVLSRSRFKYVWFSEHPFTSELAIGAHEKAFGCFGGIPDEIVYDQDKVFIVDENKGDLILTDAFRAYTKERSFQLHFCRKADPESKGKIENGVKYVKQNFLYNRSFYTIETLNDDVVGWLGRTANVMPHNRTMKPPYDEWILEKPFLKPYTEFVIKPSQTPYTVRKDNAISWKGNFYVLPLGTYKGQVVSNTDLRRDKLGSIEELIQQVSQLFDNPGQAVPFLREIHGEKPRYIRDQLTSIRHTIEKYDKQTINEALDYCSQNSVYSAIDFKAVVEQKTRNKTTLPDPVIIRLNPLTGSLSPNATIEPATSKITEYQSLMQNKN
jgi:hypothetical protein